MCLIVLLGPVLSRFLLMGLRLLTNANLDFLSKLFVYSAGAGLNVLRD